MLRPIDKRVSSTVLWDRLLGCRGLVPILRDKQNYGLRAQRHASLWLQIAAAGLGIAKLETGPKALAVTLDGKAPLRPWAAFARGEGAAMDKRRLLFEAGRAAGEPPLEFFEEAIARAQEIPNRSSGKGGPQRKVRLTQRGW